MGGSTVKKKWVKDKGLSVVKKEAESLSQPNETMILQVGKAFHTQSYKPEEVGVANFSKENTGVEKPLYIAEVKKPDGKTTTFLCIDAKKSLTAYDVVHQRCFGKL